LARGDEDREGHEEEEEGSRGRTLAILALLAAGALIGYVLLFGGDEYEVTANFENASQLVDGAQVAVAGRPVGTVKSVELAPDNTALVTFTVGEDIAPLPQGTQARVNPPSLSSVAGNQVELTLPADSTDNETIEDGGRIEQQNTIANVDLDEIFNTLDDRTVRNLKKTIKGFEISYDGVGEQANKGFRYLNPFLSTSRRVFGELNRDERALEALIVDGSKLSGALAERAPDLEQLIGNLNRFQGALARQKSSLSEAVAEFPDFMRQANTTFVNLRATLDDVDPLVDASKPVAVRLRPFFAEFRAAAADAVPTVRDLDHLVLRPGPANDLVDLNRLQPAVTEAALGSGAPECAENPNDPEDLEVTADDDFTQGAFGEQICALRDGRPSVAFLRAYTPELGAWLDDFSHSGTIDANGGMGRISTTFNTFTPSLPSLPNVLPNIFSSPLSPTQQYDGLTTDQRKRCPGTTERNPGDDSTPFTENGELDCDPTEVPPGA
jgi:phospholipid/cholesterol/gamma-HCH transport system substrate-binding protein